MSHNKTQHLRAEKDLTRGPIARPLAHLALPILGSSFLHLLYSFVDMAWLGRLSSEAVAAAGAASVFIWIATSLSLVTKVGCEVTVAHAIGKGNRSEAATYASHGSTIALLMGMLLLLLYSSLAPSLIGFYQLAPHIDQQGIEYLRIVSIGLPLSFMMHALSGTYNATGHSKIPFVINAIALGLNIVLDPLLIFHYRLGIRGAALATVIAQGIGATLYLYQMLLRDRLLGGIKIIRKLSPQFTTPFFKIGGPVALMNSLFAFINMSLGRLASLYGGHIGVLTLTTGGQLEGLSWNTAQGFSTALSAFVSQNFGAGKLHRAHTAFRYTLLLSLAVGTLAMLFYYFGDEWLFSLIVPNVAAYTAGALYLRIQAVAQLFSMLEITCQGFFYGIRQSLIPSLISIIGNLIRIPLALLLLPLYKDITILWWIIAGTSVLKGITAIISYLKTNKRQKQLLSAN